MGVKNTLSIIQFEELCVGSLCFTEECLYYGHNSQALKKSVSFSINFVFPIYRIIYFYLTDIIIICACIKGKVCGQDLLIPL
jgi:hypothetical protein